MNFILWYYSQGVVAYFETMKNLAAFLWYYFSIGPLFGSLFAPWKKVLLQKDWTSWNPKKSIELFLENTFFRIFGALVRLCVIGTGLFAELVLIVGGFVLFFVRLALPVAFLFALVEVIMGDYFYILLLLATVVLLISAMRRYSMDRKIPYAEMSFYDLAQQDWFERVWMRIGKSGAEMDKSILQDFEAFEKFLISVNLTIEDFKMLLDLEMKRQIKIEQSKKVLSRKNLFKIDPIGRHWTHGYTPLLDAHSIDLAKNDPTEYEDVDASSHSKEIQMITLILKRPTQNNALVVGEPGVGKKSIIHHLGKKIREGTVDDELKNKRLVLVSLGEGISATADKGGDIENYLNNLFSEVAFAENIILAIENLGEYLDPEGSISHVSIASVLEKYLTIPTFQILATSTTRDYHRLIEKNQNLVKSFEMVEAEELTEDQSIKVIFQKFRDLERERVIFSYQAIRNIVKRSGQIKRSSPLPERAVDLATDILTYWEKEPSPIITEEVVDKFISLKTGIPLGEIEQGEREKLLGLEKIMHEQIIGQEEAVTEIAEAIRRVRSGVGDSQKPIGSFLFLGPTGVGKTETAKALAKAYFGDEDKMIRFDMSEYQTQASIERIIGSDITNKAGLLTSKVKDSPFSLLLLDELEKAHPDILNLFLQVLDEGFITDALGERVYFNNMIIIATSNAGAPLIKEMSEQGKGAKEIKEALINLIVEKGIYRLEFLNRFEGVIYFRPLKDDELVKVTELILNKFAKRLESEKNIQLQYDPAIVSQIIQKGYDPIFGARSIVHYISDTVESVVAKKIIEGNVKRGEQIVVSTGDLQ